MIDKRFDDATSVTWAVLRRWVQLYCPFQDKSVVFDYSNSAGAVQATAAQRVSHSDEEKFVSWWKFFLPELHLR